jgi:hypothetical protein
MTAPSKHRHCICALIALGLVCAASAARAAPASFGISAVTITAGAGYGVDTGSKPENGGNLLDVRFAPGFAGWLNMPGGKTSFDFARITFAESNGGAGKGNAGIRKQELDDLNLTTRFVFNAPSPIAIELLAQGTAIEGLVDDSAVDFQIVWTPVEADFGAAGRLRISVDPLAFSDIGPQTARATVELLAAPDRQLRAVPEPTTLALAAVGLWGAGFARRRQSPAREVRAH